MYIPLGGKELQSVREELSALTTYEDSPRRGVGGAGGSGAFGGRVPGSQGGNGGNMPYSAANAAVLRNVPGV